MFVNTNFSILSYFTFLFCMVSFIKPAPELSLSNFKNS